MNFDSVLDKAFSLLESSLEQKQAQAREQMELTKSLKQMDLSSQEKIQRLINQGALDRQELVNQGLLTQQELQNSGLLSRQEAENSGRLSLQETENRGRLDIQKQSDLATYNRTKLSGDTAVNIANINARSQRENNWKTVDEFSDDGTKTGQYLVNPSLGQRSGGSSDKADSLEEITAIINRANGAGKAVVPEPSQSSIPSPTSTTIQTSKPAAKTAPVMDQEPAIGFRGLVPQVAVQSQQPQAVRRLGYEAAKTDTLSALQRSEKMNPGFGQFPNRTARGGAINRRPISPVETEYKRRIGLGGY